MTVSPLPTSTAVRNPAVPNSDVPTPAVHPRSAVATRNAPRTRRQGARLTPVDPQNAPTTIGTRAGQGASKARGLTLYVGLDELTAADNGTNLTEIAQALQALVNDLVPEAQTRAVIALDFPGAGRRDLDAVRAAANGLSGTGAAARSHGPVRSRIPGRLQQPALREEAPAALRIDIPRREVHIDGQLAKITTKEFDLLATLVMNEGTTLSRQDLIEAVWAGESPDERTVDVHVRRLRNRLGSYKTVVRTIRGNGYRFDTHPDVQVWHATAVR